MLFTSNTTLSHAPVAHLSAKESKPHFHHQTSNDFDEQATFLRDWHQDYTQITTGSFQGFISEVHFEQLSLFWEYTSQRLYQQGHLDADTIAIGVPLSQPDSGLFCGAVCEPSAIYLYAGSQGFEFISPKNLTIGLMVFSRSHLMSLLSAEDQDFFDGQCQHAHLMRVSHSTYFNLVAFLKDTFQALKTQPKLANSPLFREATTVHALQLVCDSMLNQDESPNILCHKSWELFSTARALSAQRQDNPLSVADLCVSLDISRRSLQYHFEKTLGTSPLAFLRAERLNAVRHMLKNANSVTEAATHWGFWHFGHFSQEYKKMFGELPSTTFKRLHSLN